MFWPKILKHVFPLLESRELIVCMSVNKEWREAAKEDYFWKCLCEKRWPSISKQTSFHNPSYLEVYKSFHNPQPTRIFVPPNLSFRDLEFYIDIWAGETLMFSQVVPGHIMPKGSWAIPAGIKESLRFHMASPDYTLTVLVEESFNLLFDSTNSISVLAGRKDSNKVACVLKKTLLDFNEFSMPRILVEDELIFAPSHHFVSKILCWVSVLFRRYNSLEMIDVFAIELDFFDSADTEVQVLCLLDMLDWK